MLGRMKFYVLGSSALAAAALALGGCETKPVTPPGVTASVTVGPPSKSQQWQQIATDADEDRIARMGLAWSEGLAEANKSNSREVRAEGDLLLPRSALERPDPTPGSYNCRLIKLGRSAPKTRAFESFKPFFCYVEIEDGLLTITKQTGSQRPAGRLWEDDDAKRLVFLGSLAKGAEDKTLAYGDDHERDLAGVVERIAPFKWRLVLPWPQDAAKLDVYELTPVDFTNQPPGRD